MQPRIAILIINLTSGGAERLLVNTIPTYKEKGIPIKIYLLNDIKNKSDYVEILRKHVEIETLSSFHANNPIHILKLRKVLKKEQIIHVHLFPANLWLVIAKLLFRSRVKLINTEHGIVNKSFMNKFYIRNLVRFIYKRYDYHVAISKKIASKIASLTGKPERIIQINNGVDVQRVLNAEPIPKEEICRELKISTDSTLLLMTARFHEQKNQKGLINVLPELKEDTHLLFLGEGKLQRETEDHAVANALQNRVHFLGFRSNAVNYMKSVDINILSSHYEGLSGAVVEALSSGKPFIGSDVPGINDVVEDDRYLFSDTKDLVTKINGILENSESTKQMVEDSMQHVRNFEMQSMIGKHINFYQTVLDEL